MAEDKTEEQLRSFLAKLAYNTSTKIRDYLEKDCTEPIYFTWDIRIRLAGNDIEQTEIVETHTGCFTDGTELKLK